MKNKSTNWENLSTPALEKLLAADFLSDEDSLSPEEIHEITEVIARREKEANTPPQVDVDTAWETFLAKVKDLPPEEAPTIEEEDKVVPFQKPRRSIKKLRWAVAAAAVLCVLVVPASATGILDDFVSWTADTFSFSPSFGKDVQGLSRDSFDELYKSVNNITDLDVLPTWYPEGSRLENILQNRDNLGTAVYAKFSYKGNMFYLHVNVVTDTETYLSEYQKNEGSVEEYYANHIPHYIMENYEQNIVTWRNENAECVIYGDISSNDLKMMISSIYL